MQNFMLKKGIINATMNQDEIEQLLGGSAESGKNTNQNRNSADNRTGDLIQMTDIGMIEVMHLLLMSHLVLIP